MTDTNHAHHHHQHHGGHHAHPDADTMATVLDLDAEICGEYLTDVPHRIATLAPEVTTIVDLGAGTGVGTIALARQFPMSQVVSLDSSAEMLDRVAVRARDAGVGDRVRTVVADLDSALPADLTDIDVAWASSTLHHFADPKALLRSAFDALRPGGILAALEIAEVPTFLPPDSPEGQMEQRVQSAMSAGGWNQDLDWAPTISAAGFESIDTVQIVTSPAELPAKAREYAIAWLTHIRSGLADSLSRQDRALLDDLLADDGPSSLRHRDDLAVRSRRTAWIARRPA
ncbi:class I SAM-dependent methyltransferase [Gordonia sp. CPCC 205515]|uniref:class I SAM-dependent methyltransferase n=1 Tax=Gordonia sp. CPCC 205515 TaxID=3140791 RepID=UPI003AF362CA